MYGRRVCQGRGRVLRLRCRSSLRGPVLTRVVYLERCKRRFLFYSKIGRDVDGTDKRWLSGANCWRQASHVVKSGHCSGHCSGRGERQAVSKRLSSVFVLSRDQSTSRTICQRGPDGCCNSSGKKSVDAFETVRPRTRGFHHVSISVSKIAPAKRSPYADQSP